ncbi:hypothetical protein VM1G_02836 [Cytospora mali]|uniref:Uncharacterized protein n=1 Tax=Cytospora mali TaxID=578113 RepID=A0A194VUY8_CYTMA|nr:hypothetical protein VM1G_02836 [Valsa mali]
MASTLTLLSLFIPTLVSALPDVTPIQVGAGTCYDFPNWQDVAGSDITGGFFFHPDQADNSTIDGLYTSVEVFNKTIIDITTNAEEAKEAYYCINGSVKEYYTDTPVYISETNGELAFLDSGFVPEVYQHQVDGVTLDGVFLGYADVTAWAYTFVASTGGAGIVDTFTMRLLEEQDAPLEDGEFYGFLKIASV